MKDSMKDDSFAKPFNRKWPFEQTFQQMKRVGLYFINIIYIYIS